MRAAVYTRYGAPDVVSIRDIPQPKPKPDEILIEVFASTISSGDWRARSLVMPAGMGLLGRLVFGVFGPRKKVLGTELAGVVEAVGEAVTKFSPGDEIIAYPGAKFGGHAEYTTLSENSVVAKKPTDMRFEEAAAIPFGGDTALDFLRDKGGIKPGETVLVVGASGAVGSAAVQLAKAFGAEVTGVCSGANMDLVRDLGAAHVIDYTSEDFAQNGQIYDIIIDTVASARWARSKPSLTPTGRLLVVSGSLGDMLRAPFVSRKNGKRLIVGVANGSAGNLRTLVGMVEAGKFKPMIDRCYPLDQISQAHAHVDTGRKKGSVVISIAPG